MLFGRPPCAKCGRWSPVAFCPTGGKSTWCESTTTGGTPTTSPRTPMTRSSAWRPRASTRPRRSWFALAWQRLCAEKSRRHRRKDLSPRKSVLEALLPARALADDPAGVLDVRPGHVPGALSPLRVAAPAGLGGLGDQRVAIERAADLRGGRVEPLEELRGHLALALAHRPAAGAAVVPVLEAEVVAVDARALRLASVGQDLAHVLEHAALDRRLGAVAAGRVHEVGERDAAAGVGDVGVAVLLGDVRQCAGLGALERPCKRNAQAAGDSGLHRDLRLVPRAAVLRVDVAAHRLG